MTFVSICLLAAVVGAVGWRLFDNDRVDPDAAADSSRWRFVPITSAAMILLAAIPTLGAGILLAPLGLLATIIAFRRIQQPAGATFWFGAGLNGLLTFLVVVTVAFADQLNP